MKIAVIGTGNVGGTLGVRWAQQGYQVVFGTRDASSAKVRSLLARAGENTSASDPSLVAGGAEVIILAVPWGQLQTVILSLGDLSGKILVDCSNPVAPGLQLALGTTTSGAEQVAGWAAGARVVKAFNTTGYDNMANPGYHGQAVFMPICGDDPQAKNVVIELASSLGFEAVDAGTLQTARFLEPMALLWIRLAVLQGQGPNFAFGLLRR